MNVVKKICMLVINLTVMLSLSSPNSSNAIISDKPAVIKTIRLFYGFEKNEYFEVTGRLLLPENEGWEMYGTQFLEHIVIENTGLSEEGMSLNTIKVTDELRKRIAKNIAEKIKIQGKIKGTCDLIAILRNKNGELVSVKVAEILIGPFDSLRIL